MKFLKVFSILALSVVALSVNAAATRKCTITLTGATEGQNVVKIYEDAAYATPSLTQYNFVSDPGSINFWIVENSSKWAIKTAAAIDGTILAFKGNDDESYTMTFSNVKGEVKVYDAVEDKVITVTGGGTYAFSAAANTEVTDRFQIGAPEALFYPRDVASGNWGTICYPELITSIEGADVYEIAGRNADATEIAVVEVAVEEMVAGKPYLFNATAAEQKFFYSTESPAEAPVDGACGLTGAFEQTTLGTDGYFVIKGQSFIPALGTSTVLANRAYLAMTDISAMDEYQETAGVAARFFSVGRGTATDLEGVAAEGMRDGKFIMNGRFVIVKDGKMINVLGL